MPMTTNKLARGIKRTSAKCSRSTFSHLTPVQYFPVMLFVISGHCKAKHRSMHGISDNLFDSYLQEYMWKKQHKDIFGNILYWISFYYSTQGKFSHI